MTESPTCPLCLEAARESVTCRDCRTRYHRECLAAAGCVVAGCPPPPPVPPRRTGVSLIELFIVAAIIGVLAAIAVPSHPHTRERANTRACYANQKTVVGAIEMYNLDKNTKRTTLDAAFFVALKSGGYLQSIPQDPGQGPGTSGNYHETAVESIGCRVHGTIQ